MDNEQIIKGMKKLREAISDFIDNMAMDEADEEIKEKAKAKNKKDKPSNEGGDEEDD